MPTLAISVPQYLMFFFTPSPAPCSGGLCKNPTFHFKKKRKRNRQFTGLQVLEKTREVQAQYTLKHHLSSEVKYCGNNFFFFFFFILKEVFLFLKGKILSLFWSILLSWRTQLSYMKSRIIPWVPPVAHVGQISAPSVTTWRWGWHFPGTSRATHCSAHTHQCRTTNICEGSGTRLMGSSLGDWDGSVWKRGDSGETSSLSAIPWKEVVVRWRLAFAPR